MPVDVQSVEVHPSNEEVVNIEGTIELTKENELQDTDDTGKELESDVTPSISAKDTAEMEVNIDNHVEVPQNGSADISDDNAVANTKINEEINVVVADPILDDKNEDQLEEKTEANKDENPSNSTCHEPSQLTQEKANLGDYQQPSTDIISNESELSDTDKVEDIVASIDDAMKEEIDNISDSKDLVLDSNHEPNLEKEDVLISIENTNIEFEESNIVKEDEPSITTNIIESEKDEIQGTFENSEENHSHAVVENTVTPCMSVASDAAEEENVNFQEEEKKDESAILGELDNEKETVEEQSGEINITSHTETASTYQENNYPEEIETVTDNDKSPGEDISTSDPDLSLRPESGLTEEELKASEIIVVADTKIENNDVISEAQPLVEVDKNELEIPGTIEIDTEDTSKEEELSATNPILETNESEIPDALSEEIVKVAESESQLSESFHDEPSNELTIVPTESNEEEIQQEHIIQEDDKISESSNTEEQFMAKDVTVPTDADMEEVSCNEGVKETSPNEHLTEPISTDNIAPETKSGNGDDAIEEHEKSVIDNENETNDLPSDSTIKPIDILDESHISSEPKEDVVQNTIEVDIEEDAHIASPLQSELESDMNTIVADSQEMLHDDNIQNQYEEQAAEMVVKTDTDLSSDHCTEDNQANEEAFEIENTCNLSSEENIKSEELVVSDISFHDENDVDNDINFEADASAKMSEDIENCQKDIEVVACDWDIAGEVVQSSLVEDEEKSIGSPLSRNAAFLTEVLSSSDDDDPKLVEESKEMPYEVPFTDDVKLENVSETKESFLNETEDVVMEVESTHIGDVVHLPKDEPVMSAYDETSETQDRMTKMFVEEKIKADHFETKSAIQDKPLKMQHDESITQSSFISKEKSKPSNEDAKKNEDTNVTTAVVIAVLAIAISFILYHMLRHKS